MNTKNVTLILAYSVLDLRNFVTLLSALQNAEGLMLFKNFKLDFSDNSSSAIPAILLFSFAAIFTAIQSINSYSVHVFYFCFEISQTYLSKLLLFQLVICNRFNCTHILQNFHVNTVWLTDNIFDTSDNHFIDGATGLRYS